LNGITGKQPDLLVASFPVEITSGNVNATLTLARGSDITGRIVTAEGADEIPVETLKLRLMPRPISSDVWNGAPDSDGRFRLANVSLGQKQLTLPGLDERFYVKQIRVNGNPAQATRRSKSKSTVNPPPSPAP
jgi:hypothetical protein